MISFTRRRRFGLTVDLVFFRPLLVDKDKPAVPGMSIPQSASQDTTIRVTRWHTYLSHVHKPNLPASRQRRRRQRQFGRHLYLPCPHWAMCPEMATEWLVWDQCR